MNITQVTPGMIPIPPNGWGAVEKIIWNYKLNFEKLGHHVDIQYLNQVDPNKSDIVHIHIANLALEAAERGIPYIFSLHDHHVVHYGKGSFNYNQNLEAIKKSVISITHAEFLVDYFEDTDKLFFLPHGVDTNYFTPDNRIKTEHKLLCLANNGLAGDSSFDRKGFLYAIDAAKILKAPITIAGPKDNLKFFEHYPEHLKYEKLNLRCDSPTEDEILELYRDHSIFLHPSMLEAGHPNLTLLEAISTGLPVVGTYDGTKDIDGLIRVQRDVDSLINGIIEVSENYYDISKSIENTRRDYDWSNICKRLLGMYEATLAVKKEFTNDEAKKSYINAYQNTDITPKDSIESVTFVNHFVDGPFLEIKGNTDKKYKVQFLDEQGLIHYEEMIGCNMWVKLSRKYFTKWTCKVYDGNKLVHNHVLNLKGQRVLIGLDSKSLGDTLAWFPYVEEFRKKHQCEVIVSTFWNKFFKDVHPELEFIEPGSVSHNLYAKYDIGWFYDNSKEPEIPNTIPLQKTASNILGLDFKEILPNLDFTPKEKPYNKYVAISTISTAQCKHWYYWQEVIDYLVNEGYKVIEVSKEESGLKNITNLEDTSIENTMNVLYHADLYIGLSSGISWLNWALNKTTIMISNFTNPDHEFNKNCIRIINHDVCHGCWNKAEFTFDRGDWNWCPIHKGTDKQFECHKEIKADVVINKIKTLL